MASISDVNRVRRNTNVAEDDEAFTYSVISEYIDTLGVAGASAQIWLEKAAAYADLVDISEAGSTERLGQLRKQATDMSAEWTAIAAEESGINVASNRVKLHPMGRD